MPTFESVVHLAPGEQLAPFEEIATGFEHRWTQTSHPFTGAAAIDVDGDGREELFVGGGEGQPDVLLRYIDGRLQALADEHGLSSRVATHGATAIDMDSDGDTDLLVARGDGAYLYLNTGGRFSARRLPLRLPPGAVPFSVAVSDINRDGHADLYVSVFVSIDRFRSATYNDPQHARRNVMLLNRGDLTFTDITDSAGTAGRQNSFLAVFTDLDEDGWPDLIVAQNTGEVELFRNRGDLSFAHVASHTGYGFWMGLALGDIDRDGDQDIYLSNIGTSIPDFLTSGDLRDDQRQATDWLLWRNDGGFSFTDVSADYAITGYGFAWGAVFEDLDLDGHLDLLVAQNYIKWPLHKLRKLPGKVLLQRQAAGGAGFRQADTLGINNPYFGQSPLIVDFDGDARPDLVWLNIDGPLRAFLNRSTNNALAVALPDTLAYSGSRVSVLTAAGVSHTREAAAGVGLMTDQSSTLFFGLGQQAQVERVSIRRPDGTVELIERPAINTTLRLARQP